MQFHILDKDENTNITELDVGTYVISSSKDVAVTSAYWQEAANRAQTP